MFNNRKWVVKTLSILLSIMILSSAISLPAFAQVLIEQAAYNNILNTDLQGKTTTPDLQQLDNKTETPKQDLNSNKDNKTNEQKQAEYKENQEKDIKDYKSNRFIVKFTDEKSVPQFSNSGKKNEKDSIVDANKVSAAGIEASDRIKGDKNKKFAVIDLKDALNSADFMSAMKKAGLDKNIEYIQPDYLMTASADPLLEEQWGYNGTQMSGENVSVGADVIGAWENSQGEGVLIAVLDSGIDLDQPDLVDSFYTNNREIAGNRIDDDGNGYIDDKTGWDFYNDDNSVNDSAYYSDQWHGTHVAGIISAQKDNNTGIAGVAPEAKILPIKIFQGGMAYTSDIIDAIAYADEMGAKVINCSWGSRFNNPALEQAIANSSALFVCASGNNLYNMDNYPVYPAAYSTSHNNVISVAAVDQSGKLCRFSNYGPNTVDIAAPGKSIISTWINGEYQSLDGTSMSAAFVSGAAALVFSEGTYTSASAAKERLIMSADTVTGLEDKMIGGKMLNCSFASGNQTGANSNVFNIPDTEVLPESIPNTEPSDDDYQLVNAENSVTTVQSMNNARAYSQAVTLNGKIYVIGGIGSNSVERYDPLTDTWTNVASMNMARGRFGAVVFNSKIYVFGGLHDYGSGSGIPPVTTSIESYDPTTDVWTTLRSTMPVGMDSFSTTLIPGTSSVYIIGGYVPGYTNTVSNAVYEFNLATNTWTTKTSLGWRSLYAHTAFYYNGEIYLEGGMLDLQGTYNNVEYMYNISSGVTSTNGGFGSRCYGIYAAGIVTNDRFISIGSMVGFYTSDIKQTSLLTDDTNCYVSYSHMLAAKSGVSAALLNGKVYIFGGYNINAVAQNNAEVMDLGWYQKATLPASLTDYKSVENNGKIYVMGGSTLVNGANQRSNTVYMYDTVNDNWDTAGTMPVYAKNFSLTSAFGKIYVFGGQTSATLTGTYTVSNQIYEFDPNTSAWTARNTLSAARYSLSSVLLDGKIYVTGGINSSGSSATIVETYDPLTNIVTVKNSLPSTYSGHYSCVLAGTIYLFMSSSSTVRMYTASTDSWTSTSPSGSYTGNLFAPINDYLCILGTNNDSSVNPTFYKYLPKDNACTNYLTFNYFNKLQQTVVVNNKAYIFTGSDTVYSTGLVEYTPSSTAWSQKAIMNYPKADAGSVVLGNSIYVVGGNIQVNINNPTPVSWVARYDEQSDTWSDFSTANLTYARSKLGVAVANGKIYAIGGLDTSTVLSCVEEYDPSSNTWTTKTPIPAATMEMAIATYNGIIYIFGGWGSTALSTVRAYNPATDTWSVEASMPTARFGCRAAVINGKIYVVGGFTQYESTNVLEVYDPSTHTWDTTKAGMPQAVGYAGVVANDTLYVIGGYNSLYGVMNSAYQYSPTIDKWLTWEGPNRSRYGFGAILTSKGIYAIGGRNLSEAYLDVEFAPLNSLSNDYLHLGDDTVNITGNYARTYTDMSYTAPGFNVEISRTYNSKDNRTTGNIISTGWTFGFQGKIDIEGNNAVVRLPKGSGNTFQINTDGTYTALDSRSTLVKNADNSYTLTTKDQYTYGFNSSGYLTWMRDRNGNTITITLNASNQPTQITDQAGKVTTITYSSNRISTITDPAGRVVTYSYNASNQLYRVIDPNGNSTYYYYTNGYLTSIKDNTNSTVIESVTYLPAQTNELPRVGTITNRYGNATTYTYADGDGLLMTTDSNGRTTSTWFDKMVYPIRTLDAEGKETRTVYTLEGGLNKYGEAYEYADRNDNSTYYLRDSKGNVTKQINPDSSYKEYTYDSKNNLLSVKDETGKYTYYVYDTNGINLLKTAQPLNGTDVFGVAPNANFAITENTYYTGAEALSQVWPYDIWLAENSDGRHGWRYDIHI